MQKMSWNLSGAKLVYVLLPTARRYILNQVSFTQQRARASDISISARLVAMLINSVSRRHVGGQKEQVSNLVECFLFKQGNI
jgi:hypothetical protein